ncbi:MAG: hypothetical protein KDB79_16325 [Acidobacteria bacterium]|nr:hypothetical protein [Acidobacteriota bacterium]
MSQNFQPGDFLIFQIESAYGLLRLLAIEEAGDDTIWHLAAYEDMFLDIDMADAALERSDDLKLSLPHAALTNRAFEATQTARMLNKPLDENDLDSFRKWKNDPQREVSDRTVRLLLGLR